MVEEGFVASLPFLHLRLFKVAVCSNWVGNTRRSAPSPFKRSSLTCNYVEIEQEKKIALQFNRVNRNLTYRY